MTECHGDVRLAHELGGCMLFACFCLVGLFPRPEGICLLNREERIVSVFHQETRVLLGRFPGAQCFIR